MSSYSFRPEISPIEVLATTASLTAIRLWLDDDFIDRAAPRGWVHVATVGQAKALIGTGLVIELSLDNDLSNDELYGVGIQVIDYICEEQVANGRDFWPEGGIILHTANPSARDAMERAIKRYGGLGHRVEKSFTASGKPRFTFRPLG